MMPRLLRPAARLVFAGWLALVGTGRAQSAGETEPPAEETVVEETAGASEVTEESTQQTSEGGESAAEAVSPPEVTQEDDVESPTAEATAEEPEGEEARGEAPQEGEAQEGDEPQEGTAEEGEEPQEGEAEEPAPPADSAEDDVAEQEQPLDEESEDEAEPLSPEEQAKRDELKRKREEREAKRRAKKEKEAAKREAKRLAQEATHEEHLAEVLAKGYEALEAGRLDKARDTFESYRELDGGTSFEGEMGLAKTDLAAQNPAGAVEHALKAAKASSEPAAKAEALCFAAEATLAARPRDEITGQLLPGTEAFHNNALRYYMQALAADPDGATEARRALDEAFPSPEDERTERFYAHFLESSESAPREHARRLASTYEAMLSGRIDGPLVVAGGIQPPEKTSGERPPYPQDPASRAIRRRLVASFIVSTDGTVSEARVLNGIDRRRDRMAEKVFDQWTFEPARLPNGTPVEVHWVMAVDANVEPLAEEPAEGDSGEGDETAEALPDEPQGKDDQ